ncbi:MAG: carbon starvation protein A, partial [Deltaproteobacteria bacterium CG07_land_8_20_14_0_80_38_7]
MTTILGLLILTYLIIIGQRFPIIASFNFWSVILLVYCFIASVIPVNVLLQPRDYLSAFLLFFGVGVGFLGILFSRPDMNIPAFIKTNQPLWPLLFVTVACGAISGFHSLVSSGTTSKQLSNEKDAKRIGYGAMILEGGVALLAVICVASGLSGYSELLQEKGNPIYIFAKGYASITKPILKEYGAFIAITMLNAFILTTLDTATRIARYITDEIFYFKNRFFSTFIIVLVIGYLAISGEKTTNLLWQVFGASNQLISALALIVISIWLLSLKKNFLYTLIPAVFMLVTTIAALILQAVKFFRNNWLLFTICLVLIFLALFILFESKMILKKWFFRRINGNR